MMKTTRTHTGKATSGTRNAVETAIDLSKENKTATWEDRASKLPEAISPWLSTNPDEGNEPGEADEDDPDDERE